MAYKLISDYGVIGNMHSAALVGLDGSIDWLCLPRFDSPSVFAAILDDAKGGRFQVRPAGPFRSRQEYLPETNVLVTALATDSGAGALTDFMPMSGTPEAPGLGAQPRELVRIVRCDSGRLDLEAAFEPRLNYARGETSVKVAGRHALAQQGEDVLSLTSSAPLEPAAGGAAARFTLRAGEEAVFVLHWADPSPPGVAEYDAARALDETVRFWVAVARDWRYEGRWQSVVQRSMLALHLLIYAPTGAVCAAVTTSLPERIGGDRNWDYRFAWLRDAAFTMDVFNRLAHTEYTRPFVHWIGTLALCSPDSDPHALFPISPDAVAGATNEEILDHLEGYRGSRPVRIGNAAFNQFQLDIYGEVMLAIDSYQRAGGRVDEPLWNLAQCLVEETIANWERPDHGIWEFRTEPRHFTFSKLMCWVALDRGIRLARALRRDVDFDAWRRVRGLVREDILANGWRPARGSFVQYYGGESLDASLLFMPMVGFLPGDDPRVLSTIEAIQRELAVDGMVYRYLPEEARDGLAGGEGTFTMCSLWLAGALVTAGRLEEARRLFERVLSFSNHVGLFSEMLDPATGTYLGNYPQAFTHIALVHTARHLDRALTGAARGKVVAA